MRIWKLPSRLPRNTSKAVIIKEKGKLFNSSSIRSRKTREKKSKPTPQKHKKRGQNTQTGDVTRFSQRIQIYLSLDKHCHLKNKNIKKAFVILLSKKSCFRSSVYLSAYFIIASYFSVALQKQTI